MTQRQKQLLDIIRESIRTRGFPPTIREMCRAMGIASLNGVTCHLKALERLGKIRRCGFNARAIVVCGDPVSSERRLLLDGRQLVRSLLEQAGDYLPLGFQKTARNWTTSVEAYYGSNPAQGSPAGNAEAGQGGDSEAAKVPEQENGR